MRALTGPEVEHPALHGEAEGRYGADRLTVEREEATSAPFDLHAVARPAGRFTGDFYLTRSGPDGLWLALGDVAGKGLDAALVSSLAQEILEPLMRQGGRHPRELVRTVHEELLREPRSPLRFLTLVVAHINRRGGLRLVNAGHCLPLLASAEGTVREIPSHGPVTGVFPESSWGELAVNLTAGDTLVLYSDGLLESTSPAGEELGLGRLHLELARRAPGLGAAALATELLRVGERHRGGRPAHDDITVLVVRHP